jgi:hypothetical protein
MLQRFLFRFEIASNFSAASFAKVTIVKAKHAVWLCHFSEFDCVLSA